MPGCTHPLRAAPCKTFWPLHCWPLGLAAGRPFSEGACRRVCVVLATLHHFYNPAQPRAVCARAQSQRGCAGPNGGTRNDVQATARCARLNRQSRRVFVRAEKLLQAAWLPRGGWGARQGQCLPIQRGGFEGAASYQSALRLWESKRVALPSLFFCGGASRVCVVVVGPFRSKAFVLFMMRVLLCGVCGLGGCRLLQKRGVSPSP